jgi:broad specificity phosphatase PhoE
MTTTTWHWVRHGPTHQKTFVGWRDVHADLSDTDQLTRLDAHLPDNALVISSDLIRCVQTADAITNGRARLPANPHLRELHFGSWDGVHFSKVSEKHPVLSRAYWETPGHHTPPGGESWDAATHRVHTTMQHITRQNQGRDIIAVAHFGVILTQVQMALGIPAAKVLAHKIDNLSVTKISWGPCGATVHGINHLP